MRPVLSSAQLAQFNEQGYLILPGMVDHASCGAMLQVTQQHLRSAIPPVEYEADVGYPGAPASLDAPGGKTARRLRNAWHRDASFRQWASDPRLVSILALLLNEDVSLALAHHNCIMTKHPDFGSATGWHRDIRYWSYARPDLISVWLALGPENAENGGLKFIPASHRMSIESEQLDQLDFLRPDHPKNRTFFEQGVTPQLQRGDVVFFHSRLFHAAGKNSSDAVKASVVFAYRGKSNLPVAGSKSAAAGDIELGSGST
jgi:phytanoyl-CoA hydroxylase